MFLFALFVYSLLVHRSLFSLYLCLSIVLIVLNIGYRETGVIVLSHTYCEKTLVWQQIKSLISTAVVLVTPIPLQSSSTATYPRSSSSTDQEEYY